MLSNHGIRSHEPTMMDGVLLATCRTKTHPMQAHGQGISMVYFYSNLYLNQKYSQSIFSLLQTLFSQSNSIKEHMKRFYIQFTIKSHYTKPKVDLQWLRRQLNDIPKDVFMSFKPTKHKSTIHTRRIILRVSHPETTP